MTVRQIITLDPDAVDVDVSGKCGDDPISPKSAMSTPCSPKSNASRRHGSKTSFADEKAPPFFPDVVETGNFEREPSSDSSHGSPKRATSKASFGQLSRTTSKTSVGQLSRTKSKDGFSRQITTESVVSRRISSDSFKRCITGEEPEGQLSLDDPMSPQVSGESTVSPIPDILEPMSPMRASDLIMFLPEELEQTYQLKTTIGRGGFGVVRKAVHKEKKKLVAIKTINMDDVKYTNAYGRECIVAWMCEHPYLVKLLDCFSDDKTLHLVMEYLSGKTVNDLVKMRMLLGEPRGLVADMQERFIWAMLSGISYLHHHKVVHRDCKPENFMQKTDNANAPLIMMDFGLAVRCEKDKCLSEKVGTAECAAPEVSQGKYNEKCDVWSIGVVSYMICVGQFPFVAKTPKAVMRKVRDTEAKFDPEKWNDVKPAVKEIVQNMLIKDPKLRVAAKKLADQNQELFEQIKKEDQDWKSRQSEPKEGQGACCTIS